MTPIFSIIIPVQKINSYLRDETVPSILKQTYQSFEIIILPDRKTSEKFKKTKIIPTFPKTGPADKRDIGARAAKGEILAFLDDDSYPRVDWLVNALVVFNRDRKKIKTITGVCGPTLTPIEDNLLRQVSGAVWSSWLGCGGAGIHRCTLQPRREVDDYPSVNLLIKKDDFLTVGGFDSNFWPGEDTKLCLDLTRKLKKKIIYDPRVLVFHHRREIFLPHLTQIGRYAVHRGYFARVLPETSLRLGYFIPSLFVLCLVGLPLSSFMFLSFNLDLYSRLILFGYLLMIGIYLMALLANSLGNYLKSNNLKVALLLMPAIILTHIFYGVLFIRGFLTRELKD